MTMHHDVEERLRHAFALAPSPECMRRLDDRVARAIARPAPAAPRWGIGRGMLVRPVAVLGAFVVLTGAVAGSLTLLERMTQSSSAGVRDAWDRAEVLGISRQDAGVTLTLERAYADLNQVIVFLEVAGLTAGDGAAEPVAVDAVAQLRDPSGRVADEWAWGLGGSGDAESDLAASILSWDGAVTTEAGTWELAVSTVGYGQMMDGSCTAGELAEKTCTATDGARVDGLWRFEFQLPAPEGALVRAGVSDTQGAASITLTELRLAPSAITGRLYLELNGSPVTSWAPTIGAIRHDGEAWQQETNPNYTGRAVGDGGTEFMTSVGVDPSGGTWEIEISEILVASDATGDMETRLQGPWILSMVVPEE
jgi:hypothetical protein